MSMKEELKKLKPGDVVFVEPGPRAYGCPDWHKVSSVGRKYISIFLYNSVQKFDLETGRSVHGDFTGFTHDNGSGYYLHLTEESYKHDKESERILALARDGIENLRQKVLVRGLDLDLAKDLLELFKKHGMVNDQP